MPRNLAKIFSNPSEGIPQPHSAKLLQTLKQKIHGGDYHGITKPGNASDQPSGTGGNLAARL